MTAEQRAELMELSQQAFGDPRLAQALAQLDAQLQGLRPGRTGPRRAASAATTRWAWARPPGRWRSWAGSTRWPSSCRSPTPARRWRTSTSTSWRRQLGEQARVDARALAELERELRRQGLFERMPDGSLRLSPKALRRLGESALRDVVDRIGGRRGERRPAAPARPASRPARPGRGRSATPSLARAAHPDQRRAAPRRRRPARLDVTDVEIVETEQRSRAAVALCVDTSWSMVQDGRWVPMKRTALALHQLISTRFRGDALKLITFGRHARAVELGELIGLEGAWEQGTNLHHALLLAGQHLRRHPDAQPVVLVVTDGEPTAHLEPDGEALFDYPPSPQTLAATVGEVDRLTGLRASITIFRLGDDPRLARFVDAVARRCGGRWWHRPWTGSAPRWWRTTCGCAANLLINLAGKESTSRRSGAPACRHRARPRPVARGPSGCTCPGQGLVDLPVGAVEEAAERRLAVAGASSFPPPPIRRGGKP